MKTGYISIELQPVLGGKAPSFSCHIVHYHISKSSYVQFIEHNDYQLSSFSEEEKCFVCMVFV